MLLVNAGENGITSGGVNDGPVGAEHIRGFGRHDGRPIRQRPMWSSWPWRSSRDPSINVHRYTHTYCQSSLILPDLFDSAGSSARRITLLLALSERFAATGSSVAFTIGADRTPPSTMARLALLGV
jgi:hypothetical protein